ncbi:hypothetical protein MA4S0726RB_1870 [Mycobacteroides abscessus 4S-0726-RB]|nr:hypothetical protein MA4S0726RA_2281 [Mycobacteroides abscessus 4S-0726-RA]EIT96808.1 hypothetical protein MA4S0303_2344 [Mycobacteroides abscessus 4S-0303]EIT98094.1 hypothetical protein MA4S0726RB_1870 [Mycobacteroides abscessus 4S-0726-RB]EIV08849.1 hypothetical protein MA4S0206_2365 [Mycobacteroides abscessus 4S-0206]EIV50711.1 hypothetical protein MA4S0116R_2329 [Mycobacteroides abscessus 4S-0116-R]EIV62926.1 hypothetical protein MA4S0116S_1419 [Mycobacteroides abscessus 4S-0116-S]
MALTIGDELHVNVTSNLRRNQRPRRLHTQILRGVRQIK